jgi:hypothetical protein
MLGMMKMMDLEFEKALQIAQRAVALAEQIGHRRAAMIAYHGITFLAFDLGDLSIAKDSSVTGLVIAETLGARRFIAEGLMLRAQCEFLKGDLAARETLAAANAIARETPSYILPFGLGLEAVLAPDEKTRKAALAEGEALLTAGAVSHNYLFFNRYAMDACIAAGDWSGVRYYAAAMERSMANEPFPMSDFLVARARAIAAAGEGRKDEAKIQALVDQARSAKWKMVIPALEAALAL